MSVVLVIFVVKCGFSVEVAKGQYIITVKERWGDKWKNHSKEKVTGRAWEAVLHGEWY